MSKKFKLDLEKSIERCRTYRTRILQLSQQGNPLHIAPAFSCVEIVDCIYNELMEESDIFLMSKGHGCVIQYVILEERGVLTREDLDNYCRPSGRLGAHPDYGVPGISASTGSLGHGLGIAIGQAYAEKLKNTNSIVYCVLSDGEFQEGSTWEAIMMASNLNLKNIIAFMDNNDFSGLERMSESHKSFYPIVDKLMAFGWEAVEVDGHNASEINSVVNNRIGNGPLIIVCKTIKGKGVSFMENIPIWHYRSPNKEEYVQALAEITG